MNNEKLKECDPKGVISITVGKTHGKLSTNLKIPACKIKENGPVGSGGMSAVMLAERDFTLDQGCSHRRIYTVPRSFLPSNL